MLFPERRPQRSLTGLHVPLLRPGGPYPRGSHRPIFAFALNPILVRSPLSFCIRMCNWYRF